MKLFKIKNLQRDFRSEFALRAITAVTAVLLSGHIYAQQVVETSSRIHNELDSGRAGHICVDDVPDGSLFVEPCLYPDVQFVTGQTGTVTSGTNEDVVVSLLRQEPTGTGFIGVVDQIEFDFAPNWDANTLQRENIHDLKVSANGDFLVGIGNFTTEPQTIGAKCCVGNRLCYRPICLPSPTGSDGCETPWPFYFIYRGEPDLNGNPEPCPGIYRRMFAAECMDDPKNPVTVALSGKPIDVELLNNDTEMVLAIEGTDVLTKISIATGEITLDTSNEPLARSYYRQNDFNRITLRDVEVANDIVYVLGDYLYGPENTVPCLFQLDDDLNIVRCVDLFVGDTTGFVDIEGRTLTFDSATNRLIATGVSIVDEVGQSPSIVVASFDVSNSNDPFNTSPSNYWDGSYGLTGQNLVNGAPSAAYLKGSPLTGRRDQLILHVQFQVVSGTIKTGRMGSSGSTLLPFEGLLAINADDGSVVEGIHLRTDREVLDRNLLISNSTLAVAPTTEYAGLALHKHNGHGSSNIFPDRNLHFFHSGRFQIRPELGMDNCCVFHPDICSGETLDAREINIPSYSNQPLFIGSEGVTPAISKTLDSSVEEDCFAGFEALQGITWDAYMTYRGLLLGMTDPQAEIAMADSDDVRARFNPGFTLNSTESPVWLQFDIELPADTIPSTLRVLVESQAGTPGLSNLIQIRDWNQNNKFDTVKELTPVQFNVDGTIDVDILASCVFDPARHVNDDRIVRVMVGYQKTGFTINFPWEVRVDRVAFERDCSE